MQSQVLAALLLLTQATRVQSANVLAKRITDHMAQTLAAQPNYTCLETVERWITPKNGTRTLMDRIRFEVALVDGREMFSWPGAQKFEATDLSTMLPGGLSDTGDFAVQVHELFDGKSAAFTMSPEEQIPGSSFTRLDFTVAAEHSGLVLNRNKESTAYHGQLYIDPVSLDPRRIHLVVEVPPKMGLKAAVRELNLARVPIGGADTLLPQSADVLMTRGDGVDFSNHIEFTSCRQFTGDSVLKFDDPATLPLPSANSAPREITVPSGLYFQVRPQEGFDLTDRAVGDPIRTTLDSDLKSNGAILFSKGTAVLGRITTLTRTGSLTLLGITLETIASANAKASIHPMPTAIRIPKPLSERVSLKPSRREHEALIPLRSGVSFLSSAILIFWRT
jgi:hypothetical protein